MKSRRGLEFSVDDLASLRKFVDDPPGGVVVREQHVTLSESVVRLPFECSAADACLVGCDLTCFLLDYLRDEPGRLVDWIHRRLWKNLFGFNSPKGSE